MFPLACGFAGLGCLAVLAVAELGVMTLGLSAALAFAGVIIQFLAFQFVDQHIRQSFETNTVTGTTFFWTTSQDLRAFSLRPLTNAFRWSTTMHMDRVDRIDYDRHRRQCRIHGDSQKPAPARVLEKP